MQVGQKQAVAAKKGLVVTVCVWAAYGECHAATAVVINCQLSDQERTFVHVQKCSLSATPQDVGDLCSALAAHSRVA